MQLKPEDGVWTRRWTETRCLWVGFLCGALFGIGITTLVAVAVN